MLAEAEEFLFPSSCYLVFSCQFPTNILLPSVWCVSETPQNLKYSFWIASIIVDTFHWLRLLHWTKNVLNRSVINSDLSARSRHLKTDKNHLSGRLLKAFCFPLQNFAWYCCLLQNMAPLRFILISLPSEEGIYVEEMGEWSMLRMSYYPNYFTVYG